MNPKRISIKALEDYPFRSQQSGWTSCAGALSFGQWKMAQLFGFFVVFGMPRYYPR
jgi:hypothetical protein